MLLLSAIVRGICTIYIFYSKLQEKEREEMVKTYNRLTLLYTFILCYNIVGYQDKKRNVYHYLSFILDPY